MTKKKIFGHIVAIGSFLLGGVFTHQAFNAIEWDKNAQKYIVKEHLRFFNLDIPRTTVFDIGLGLVGTGFFIEFWQAFKPLEYKEKKDVQKIS